MSIIAAGTTLTTALVETGDTNGNLVLQTNGTTTALTLGADQTASFSASQREVITISATAATGTINYDAITQGVLYYTTNASANWTLNVRGNSGTTLNSLMSTGQSLSICFLVTQGSTAYYQTALTIDGSSVTPKWQGGSAPTAGNASSVDSYTLVIVKTGSAAFTVFEAQAKFA